MQLLFKLFKIIILLLILCVPPVFSQVTADFSMNVSSGCSPLLVQFVNKTMGSGDITFEWSFGNNNFSSQEHPISIFIEPGEYIVKLKASKGNFTSEKSAIITVFENPAPVIAVDNNMGCVPHKTKFSIESVYTPYINSCTWDFGDGNLSNNVFSEHEYIFTGSFNVSVRITDRNGCKGSSQLLNAVGVHAIPKANFKTADSNICDSSGIVRFINQSTSINILEYNWDFGDGSNSDNTNPAHEYTELGKYTVKLSVKDQYGCSDDTTKEDYINLKGNIAHFKILSDTLCKKEPVKLSVTSILQKEYKWTFGDGTKKYDSIPSHSFNTSGYVSIQLSASSDNKSCNSVYTDSVYVDNIKTAFTVDTSFSCQLPTQVRYTDMSENAVSWEWRMGNGNVFYDRNPVNTYTTKHYSQKKEINSFSDTLITTSILGCKDILIKESNMKIILPKAYFVPNNSESAYTLYVTGCVPLKVNFEDRSSYPASNDRILLRKWIFHDDSEVSDSLVTKIYDQPGEYNAKLIVTTELGCKSETSATIRAGTSQKASFAMIDDRVCAGENIETIDLSESQSLINGWHWYFSNGSHSLDQKPEISFTDTGYMDVMLTVYYNNCPSKTFYKNKAFYVDPPVGKFIIKHDCSKHFDYSFSKISKGDQRFFWDFGDTTAMDSTNAMPSHSYAARGDYNVTLTSYNDSAGCIYKWNMPVRVRDLDSKFTVNKEIVCAEDTVTFDPSGSDDEIKDGSKNRYKWNISGLYDTKTDTIMKMRFGRQGNYKIRLEVRDVNSCTDTFSRTVRVFSPLAEFSCDSVGCRPLTSTFIQKTISDTGFTCTWNFGNGYTSNKKDSVTAVFPNTGKYSVSLAVRDALGCVDSIQKQDYITVTKPSPNMAAEKDYICIGDSIWIKCLNSDEKAMYRWNFGDGEFDSLKITGHTYIDTGLFSINFTLTDSNYCDSTMQYNISVQSYPVASFTSDSVTSHCYPLEVGFYNHSVSSYPTKSKWLFDDINAVSNIREPHHVYVKPGNYNVALIESTSNGCSDTLQIEKAVKVEGPYAGILAPDSVCRNDEITFILQDKRNVNNFIWDFGDGTMLFADTVVHIYKRLGNVFPRLILYADTLHTCDKIIVDTIYLHQLFSSFMVQNPNTCVPVNIQLTDLSYGASKKMWIYNSDTVYNNPPVLSYTEPDSVTVQFVISDNNGCKDTYSETIIAYGKPSLQISSDTTICYGDKATIYSSGGEKYIWGHTSSQDSTISVNPAENTKFKVTVIDRYDCFDTTSTLVKVLHQPDIKMPDDTAIIIGQYFNIKVLSDQPGIIINISSDYNDICDTCTSQIVKVLNSMFFLINVYDSLKCFNIQKETDVTVRNEFTIDVPSAFTPNSDGVNDMAFVKGWGIKELIRFVIYDRWGNIVYSSANIDEGWDGRYNGKKLPNNSYSYIAEAKTYKGEVLRKTGIISIIE